MYKYIFITALSLVSLSANYDNYLLQKQSDEKPKYFIKIGAYKILNNAKAVEETTEFDTHIIHMKNYYSVVSEEFNSIQKASIKLRKMRHFYKDAYIFTLYKNAEVRVKPKIIKQPTLQPITLNSYQEGVKFYQAKQYEEALASFDRALIDDENDIFARFYYAKTLYKLGIVKEAQKEFATLLKMPLKQNDKTEVQKYLDAIKAKEKRSFFNGSVTLGVGYNDNINLTTDEKITRYGQLNLLNDTNKSSSTYGLLSLELTHRYDASIFNIISSLYTYNEFAHTEQGNNLNFVDLQTGISKKLGDIRVSLPVGFNTSYLEGEHVGYNIYTAPSINYYFNTNISTTLQATLLDNTSKYMKGKDYRMLGANSGVRYQSENFGATIYTQLQQFKAKENLRFDVDKDVINGGFYSYYNIYRNYLTLNASFTKENFNKLDNVMGYKREDKIMRYGLGIGRNISKNISINLRYKHTTNDSNINVYKYDKNNYTLDCKYGF